jgi:hypothetical protein
LLIFKKTLATISIKFEERKEKKKRKKETQLGRYWDEKAKVGRKVDDERMNSSECGMPEDEAELRMCRKCVPEIGAIAKKLLRSKLWRTLSDRPRSSLVSSHHLQDLMLQQRLLPSVLWQQPPTNMTMLVSFSFLTSHQSFSHFLFLTPTWIWWRAASLRIRGEYFKMP